MMKNLQKIIILSLLAPEVFGAASDATVDRRAAALAAGIATQLSASLPLFSQPSSDGSQSTDGSKTVAASAVSSDSEAGVPRSGANVRWNGSGGSAGLAAAESAAASSGSGSGAVALPAALAPISAAHPVRDAAAAAGTPPGFWTVSPSPQVGLGIAAAPAAGVGAGARARESAIAVVPDLRQHSAPVRNTSAFPVSLPPRTSEGGGAGRGDSASGASAPLVTGWTFPRPPVSGAAAVMRAYTGLDFSGPGTVSEVGPVDGLGSSQVDAADTAGGTGAAVSASGGLLPPAAPSLAWQSSAMDSEEAAPAQ